VEQTSVRVAQEGAGVGELTWGQRHIWHPMRLRGSSLSLSAARPLPSGATVEELVDELRFYVGTYQTMRTRLQFTADGTPQQVVDAEGEFPLTVVDAAGGDPAAAARGLVTEFEAVPFDYATQWPVRAAIVVAGGAPSHLVLTVSHLALDAAAARIMFTSRHGGSDPCAAPAPQPLELARIEAGAAARRHHDAAMGHWERILRTAPEHLLPARHPAADPRYGQVSYDSPAIKLAQQVLAVRTGAGTAPVLLAAYAAALARVCGTGPLVLQLIVGNRFRPRLARVVAPVSQPGLCALEPGGMPFDDLVQHAGRRSLAASKHAYYDRRGLAELIAAVTGEMGYEPDISCLYNDRRRDTSGVFDTPAPGPDEVRAAAGRGTLTVGPPLERFNEKLMLSVSETDRSVSLLVEADTVYLSTQDMEALAREIEAVLVTAAVDPRR
jgi:hypothetical protein